MKRNTLFSFLTVAALGLLMASSATATDFVWDGGGADNKWSNPDNWTANDGYPDDNGDKATLRGDTKPELDVNVTIGELVIEDDAALTVATASGTRTLGIDGAGSQNGKVTIEAVGKMYIGSSGKVNFDGTDFLVRHTIDGDITLSTSSSKLAFTDSVTINGSGSIIGQHNTAKLLINGGKTLINMITVSGNMTVLTAVGTGGGADGIFLNGSTGTVLANAGGILLLDGSLTLDDDNNGGAKWQAKGDPNAVLQFATGLTFVDSNPELAGNFLVDDEAKLDIDLTVVTSGTMTHTNGTVDTTADTGIFFKATGNDPDFLCNTVCEAP